ncbi:hypothetical protein LR48_Vigan03g185200 [Vigna angularis]|uniref:Uncharacterized protein n=1 Tax=Phaseolus angularis TaxID=3914 RepID=A0A0L9U6Q6_PHAAN|nr:hypothetical protein LR48_Vigan03g185200 [Vigna angularis]
MGSSYLSPAQFPPYAGSLLCIDRGVPVKGAPITKSVIVRSGKGVRMKKGTHDVCESNGVGRSKLWSQASMDGVGGDHPGLWLAQAGLSQAAIGGGTRDLLSRPRRKGKEGEIDAAAGNGPDGDWCRQQRLGLSGRSSTATGSMEALLCRRRQTTQATWQRVKRQAIIRRGLAVCHIY